MLSSSSVRKFVFSQATKTKLKIYKLRFHHICAQDKQNLSTPCIIPLSISNDLTLQNGVHESIYTFSRKTLVNLNPQTDKAPFVPS